MQLMRLLADLPTAEVAVAPATPDICQITSDSRQVSPGALFVAYRGLNADLHRFIPDALARGAAAVIGEDLLHGLPVPYIRVADGRVALAWLSAAWYGHPSRSMALVGITGTDGKTTTANLLYRILYAAGRRAGLISTVNAVIGDRTYDTGLHTTTPDAPDVQRYLAQMRDAGAEIAVLETTSHGLAQHRVTGCAFDVAVITNITHEHLDFHGHYDAYRDAKALLFRSLTARTPGGAPKPGFGRLLKTAVLNRDDASFDFLAAIPTERMITYGLQTPDVSEGAMHLTAANIHHTPAGTECDLHFTMSPRPRVPLPSCRLVTPLVGLFNISNILAATGAALALGIELEAIRAGVRATVGIPGRMERLDCGQAFTAIVDFAHTPNALACALETARELTAPGGRVIAIFGSAGLRDRTKRRLMGEVAARLADLTVVTAEDPRTEDLTAIMAETVAALLTSGRSEGPDFVCIPDRQRAIVYAVQQARPGDVVMVCGKGHELSMCFGSVEHPWRDQEAMRWALEGLRGSAPLEPPFCLPTWTTA